MQINSVETLFAQSLEQSELSVKQQDVLKACLTLFSQQGYDRTTTGDIAELAGVSEGTVYKHFKNKREILNALLEPLQASVLPAVADEFTQEAAAQHFTSLAEALHFLASDRLHYILDNRLVIRVFIQEVMVNPKLFDTAYTVVSQRFAPVVMPMLTQFIGQPADLESFRVVWGLLMTYLLPVILKPNLQLDVAATTDKIVTLALPVIQPR